MADASTQPPNEIEPAVPHPRRYRWLVRLAAVYVLTVAAVAGVRWWWGEVAERRLAETVAAAQARGEKVLLADYARNEPPLPDEQNAAFFIRRSQQAMKLSNSEDWAIDNSTSLPLREDIAQIVGQAVGEHPGVLADIRTARDLDRADWGVNIVSPMWSTLLPHLNGARQVCRFARAAAIHATHRGDHAAAIEHVRDILGLSRALDEDDAFLVTHLVCLGIDAVAADAAGEIARDLQIVAASDEPGSPGAPATREQVQTLITELLDDRSRRESLRDALEGERAMQVDMGQQVGRRARVIRPAIQLDVLRLVKEGEQLITAAAAPDWPTARKLLPNPPVVTGPRVAAHVVSQSVRPALGRALSTSMHGAANARLAAVALAIRLYQLDHNGQRPPTLDALVPAYLPAVPLDPFAGGGQPLGYVPDRIAPYVYSVGENGIDDSALTPAWRPDEKTLDPGKAPDLFLRLTQENTPPPEITDPPVDEPDATTLPAVESE
ncbi:MAG TPA: hypothetical protein VGR35_02665 [Tepidisphaeraceae bacterium]|nr:hypothetical protein [Tepidisphaeraceae bacterium]